MTTELQTPSTTTPAPGRRSAGSLLLPIAGGALVLGSVLFVAGMVTSPPQDSMADADYIASLARDEARTTLSALLLHYGTMLTGLAWLAAPALVRGRRGAGLAVAGALMAALGMVTVAGNVLFDFWTGAVGRLLEASTAEAVFADVHGSAAMAVVGTVTLLGLVGPLVGYAGLARAGVISWWLLAPAVVSLVLATVLTFSPLLYGGLMLLGAVPAVVVGLRLLQRNRAEAAVAA
ncbi:hypothetical protein [Geodermatophilus sp. DSM 44513]|uniref:hypothetical protein n=1 Tax=Geodermatophilus sp. DSM 44513 TaxID=1528104 RepID=UPI00127AEB52|nr:hypothetical protein [Geodermatophilus sp. DSM 44513]WNV76104.1 hypothetical protein RTG05_02245 [Geodermatophilus sp. DSM 44513]